jgi:hypothetical protein
VPERKPRLVGPRFHLCDLGYNPGVTPLIARPPTTQSCEPHEPWPEDYVAASEYADLMMETHDQRACRGCGLYLIWEPKETAGA